MFPDLTPAALFERICGSPTAPEQVAALRRGLREVGIGKSVPMSFSRNDAVSGQDAARHVLYDLLVVLDLTLVMGKDRRGNLANRC